MTKQLLAFLFALVPAVGIAPSSAEQPASIRGVVYACGSREPVPGAYVTLRGLDDGSLLRLRSDAKGRFTKIGLTPGRWLIQAGLGTDDARYAWTREAMLESDDALSMVIGVRTFFSHVRSSDVAQATSAPAVPRAYCDPYRVPPAPSTSDRYIIH